MIREDLEKILLSLFILVAFYLVLGSTGSVTGNAIVERRAGLDWEVLMLFISVLGVGIIVAKRYMKP